MRFTEEQQKVIDTRHRNLLVSAAAGSGKTAVLVARIIEMLTDTASPVPVTSLLVVTFTNSAAAEMRERVGQALYSAIEKDPSNTYLQQQLTLLPSATIMTLHAFCLKVLKNYFYTIDLDPGFTIGDEGELTLLRQAAMAETLENAYNEGEEAFYQLVEAYGSGKSDQALEALVMSVFRLSQSHPFPEQWLSQCLEQIEFNDLDAWYKSLYVAHICEQVKESLQYLMGLSEEGLAFAEDYEGLKPMGETISLYKETIQDLLERTSSPKLFFEAIGQIELGRAKPARRGTDKEVVEPLKRIRDKVKDGIKKISETYNHEFNDAFIEQMQESHQLMTTLVAVALDFGETFKKKKAERNVLDFNDIEHFALNILMEDGGASEVAKVYQSQFHEILVDEYQDSNLVQEMLIKMVSKGEQGKPNVFMVGDIKQSIYKFRLARPELFSEKYDTYTFEASDHQKIELHRNFRSRKEVIEGINYLFVQLMSKKVGDVTYDNHAALHHGAVYDLGSEDYATRLRIIDRKDADQPAQEVEAVAVADEIAGLIHREPPMMVYDKQTDTMRQLEYRDIAVLMRSMAGWSETFVKVFKDQGIPVFSNTSTGYFDTLEIQTLLNLLRVIDNPKQDIPLLSVLRSSMFDFAADELVTVRLSRPDMDFHTALVTYDESSLGTGLLEAKVHNFLEQLIQWRMERHSLSLYEFVKRLLEDTGYMDQVSLSTGGVQRRSNITMLLSMVHRFEQSSFRGLFQFLRYMENIRKQQVDYGEAAVDDSGNQVTLMSIHGSKGLEFPVVIVAGLGKKFNKKDLQNPVLMHQTYGFGTERIKVQERQKLSNPIKEVIKDIMAREMLSEEMRIFYVALTRAREKLVLVGGVSDLEKALERWAGMVRSSQVNIDPQVMLEANTFLDWVMIGVSRSPEGRKLFNTLGISLPLAVDLDEWLPALEIVTKGSDYEKTAKSFDQEEVKDIEGWDDEAFNKQMTWVYPNAPLTTLHLSQSVSELKRLSAVEETVPYEGPNSEGEGVAYRPLFITGEQALTGAERGTVFHKVMDHIDFCEPPASQKVRGLMASMVSAKVLTQKMADAVYVPGIEGFLKSSLGQRVHKAALLNKVYQERPFVMGIPASEMVETDEEALTMIQGVVDLYFEEEDGLVLVDYKTDYAKDLADAVFVDRYKMQMSLYKRALEQQTGQKVNEIWLYLAGVQKTIQVTM